MKSIKNKISLLVAALMFVLIVGVSLYFNLEFRKLLNQNAEENARIVTRNISAKIIPFVINQDEKSIDEEIQRFAVVNSIEYAIVDNSEKLIYVYNIHKANEVNYKIESSTSVSADNNTLRVRSVLNSNNQKIGNIYLGISLASINNQISQATKSTVELSLIVILLGLIGGYVIGFITLRPISILNNTMKRVIDGDLSNKAKVTSENEIGALASVFNKMIEKITELYKNMDNKVKERTEMLSKLNTRLSNEIDDKIKNELEIRAVLKEKEVLLKEIHHRVKNNLQIISSLLFLQSKNLTDSHTVSILQDSQNRIKSMALVHEKLYKSDDLSSVDFASYVKDLVAYINNLYKTEQNQIEIIYDLDNIKISIENSVSLGLMINELVTNTFKHSFPNLQTKTDEYKKNLWVILKRIDNNTCHLTIADNGIGLSDTFEFEKAESLGLKLVRNLVKQINGSIFIKPKRNTEFRIEFSS